MRVPVAVLASIALCGCGRSDEPKASKPQHSPSKGSPIQPGNHVAAPNAAATEPAEGRLTPGSKAADESVPAAATKPLATPANNSPAAGDLEPTDVIPLFKAEGERFAMTSDGRRLVMSGRDDKEKFETVYVRVWDVDGKKLLKEFNAQGGGLVPVDITADGTRIAYGSDTICVADVESGKVLHELSHDGASINSPDLEISDDGKTVWSHDTRDVLGFDMESGKRKHAFSSGEARIEVVHVLPGGVQVAAGYDNGSIRVFDVSTGEAKVVDPGSKIPGVGEVNPDQILAIASWSDGKQLLVARYEQDAELWDVKDAKRVGTFSQGKTRTESAILTDRIVVVEGKWHTPDGKRDYDRDGVPLAVFERASGKRLGSLSIPGEGLLEAHVWNLALTADGKRVLTGTAKGDVRIFDVSNWTAGRPP